MRLGTYELHIFHCLFRKKIKLPIICQGFMHSCVRTQAGARIPISCSTIGSILERSILLHEISRWHHDGPIGFLIQPLECDNSLFGGILSQVSTSQSSNVAVKNCFLSITEYRNFTLSFTLITLLPLKISYLSNSVTEMPDNPSSFGQVLRNHSKSLCHLCYTPWYEFCDYNLTALYERQK